MAMQRGRRSSLAAFCGACVVRRRRWQPGGGDVGDVARLSAATRVSAQRRRRRAATKGGSPT
eukprot:4156752-Alexandrium_andersonii.AAC.1